MSALGNLRTHLSTLPGPFDADHNERLIQAVIAEALRDAAIDLTTKYGVTNRAAGDLRRRADEIERQHGIGGA